MCRLDSRKLEVLKAALDYRRFYHIYKSTSLPLATTWRTLRKLAEEHMVTYSGGDVNITEKGAAVLAYNGEIKAAAILARKYHDSVEAVTSFVKLLCGNYDVVTMPFANLYDFVVLLDDATVRRLKGSALEPLVAKLLLRKYDALAWETPRGKYLLGKDGIVAARCDLCSAETRCELYPQCGLQDFFKTLKMQFLKYAVEFSNEHKKT